MEIGAIVVAMHDGTPTKHLIGERKTETHETVAPCSAHARTVAK